MVQGVGRIWNISVFAVTVLSLYNILLTVKLMYNPECAKSSNIVRKKATARPHQSCVPQLVEINSDMPFINLDLKLGRSDTRLKYKYFDSILVGDKYAELNEEYLTCLATQSSLNKILSIIQVANHWKGPVSMAVFAASDDELNVLLLYILYLRQCFVYIRERVAFHLAIPRDKPPKSVNIDMNLLKEMDCGKPEDTLQHLIRGRKSIVSKWRAKLPYPQNHLRNLARKNCQSKHVFLTDVDIIPSLNLADDLNKFLRITTCKGLCAYVIPTYELDERVRFPPNKTELVRLAKKGLARPFHHKVFVYNQYATNFTRWQNSIAESTEVHISHLVTNFEFLYEPFYVAPDTVPLHDERFLGYGYTRNTQVYEMFVAGYEFLVLSPVFTCHWGLQVKKTRPPWREHQNNLNRKHFETFKREIFARYNKDPLHMVSPQKIQN